MVPLVGSRTQNSRVTGARPNDSTNVLWTLVFDGNVGIRRALKAVNRVPMVYGTLSIHCGVEVTELSTNKHDDDVVYWYLIQ